GLNSPEDLLPNGPAPEGPQKSTLSETPGAEGAEGLLPGGQPTEGQAADAAASAVREKAAFQDPYAILDKLAAEAEALPQPSPDVAVAETGVAGVAGGEAYRDPFDPAYWQMAAAQNRLT